MGFKDRWLVCVSLGEQTFRTATSVKLSTPPQVSFYGFSIDDLVL